LIEPKDAEGFCWWGICEGVYVPQFLLSYRGIGPASKLCFARIVKYCGSAKTCWPSQEQLAEDLGVTVRSIGNYLAELEQDGFLEIIQRGLKQSNEYRPLRHGLVSQLLSGTTSGLDRKESSGQDTKESSGPSIELKEVNKKEINTKENLTGKPSSEEKTQTTPRMVINEINRLDGGLLGKGNRATVEGLESDIAEMDLAAAVEFVKSRLSKPLRRSKSSEPSQPSHFSRRGTTVSALPKDPEPEGPVSSRDFVAEWNAAVPACPTEWSSKHSPRGALRKCAADPEFCARFAEVCVIAQKAHELRGAEVSYITFPWIIREKDGLLGWWRLLTDLKGVSLPKSSKKSKAEELDDIWARV
jgi:hypothetical protein